MIVKKITSLFLFFIFLLGLFSCNKPQYDIGIIGGTLINGTGNPALKDKLILINNGAIVDIVDSKKAGKFSFKTLIDASDKYLIPGLFDMHGHVTMSYRTFSSPDGVFQSSVDYNQQAAEWSLKSLLYYGVTTVRETGDFLNEGISLKNAVDSGKLSGPAIFTCGPLLETSPAEFKTMSVLVNTPEEARAEVQRQVNAGVDFIKIYASVPPGIVAAIIAEAHKYKKRVIGHLGTTSWRQAVDAGIDALVHPGPFIDQSLSDLNSDTVQLLLKLMANKQIANDPTLLVMKAFYNLKFADSLFDAYPLTIPPAVKQSWQKENEFMYSFLGKDYPFEKEYKVYQDYTKAAYVAGVKLLVGSDFNNENVIPGFSLHQELQLMSQAGIPNMALIRMATHDAAEWLGILSRSGTIETGKQADLIILNKNPIEDISNTLQIDKVIIKGNILKRDTLVKVN